ncbi:hypothetical protein BUALT_Bualt16G0067500 [Buddleja alternifolia]|uniref:UBC core domain-containing protein n=1 Tax=Buddleja alternifolia TaxID=168488 RepID=A0AAV6WK99_9LAMI|nr:hypothetical protein BUALT_Bualt16G0067500 [Buddleja alternifolia]
MGSAGEPVVVVPPDYKKRTGVPQSVRMETGGQKVRFQTNIFHPNISPSSGGISMRILRQYWVPRISMLKLLDFIRLMLIKPNLEEAHPDVADTAEMYKNDRAMYESTAQSWTQLYAMDPNAQ